jgi:hypothetical protein
VAAGLSNADIASHLVISHSWIRCADSREKSQVEAQNRKRPRVESSFAIDIGWGNLAADLYRATYSMRYVLEELKNRLGAELPDGAVEEYLRRRRDVALRRPPPLPAYSHPDVYPRFTKTIHQRMRRFKEETGESVTEAEDWLRDQLDRYRRVDHFHYTEDELFTTPEATAAFIRRVKKWHRAVGRPISGEGFEDVLAGMWSDMGLGVFLSPRNYDGPTRILRCATNGSRCR